MVGTRETSQPVANAHSASADQIKVAEVGSALRDGLSLLAERKIGRIGLFIGPENEDLVAALKALGGTVALNAANQEYKPLDPKNEAIHTSIKQPGNGPTSYCLLNLVDAHEKSLESELPTHPAGIEVVTRRAGTGAHLARFVAGADGNFLYKNEYTWFPESEFGKVAEFLHRNGCSGTDMRLLIAEEIQKLATSKSDHAAAATS